MGRAPCCDKSKVKKGPWSPEEDTILINFLHKHGTPANWIALPTKAGLNRCGKSCRLRWLNYLRPDIKRGRFTETEDNVICALYNTIGSRWSVIASKLPGRTDNDVKNYWNTKLKKKLLAQNDMMNLGARDTTTGTSSTGINNMVQFSGSFSKNENPNNDQGIITSFCVDGALPYLMDVNYLGQSFEPCTQFSNDFGFNISSSTSHQQVSSSVLDNVENNYNMVWSGSGSEGGVNESGFLMEGHFGFEQPPPPPPDADDVLLGGFGYY